MCILIYVYCKANRGARGVGLVHAPLGGFVEGKSREKISHPFTPHAPDSLSQSESGTQALASPLPLLPSAKRPWGTWL